MCMDDSRDKSMHMKKSKNNGHRHTAIWDDGIYKKQNG